MMSTVRLLSVTKELVASNNDCSLYHELVRNSYLHNRCVYGRICATSKWQAECSGVIRKDISRSTVRLIRVSDFHKNKI